MNRIKYLLFLTCLKNLKYKAIQKIPLNKYFNLYNIFIQEAKSYVIYIYFNNVIFIIKFPYCKIKQMV